MLDINSEKFIISAISFPDSSVVEQLTVNQLVVGSNPTRGAIFVNTLSQ